MRPRSACCRTTHQHSNHRAIELTSEGLARGGWPDGAWQRVLVWPGCDAAGRGDLVPELQARTLRLLEIVVRVVGLRSQHSASAGGQCTAGGAMQGWSVPRPDYGTKTNHYGTQHSSPLGCGSFPQAAMALRIACSHQWSRAVLLEAGVLVLPADGDGGRVRVHHLVRFAGVVRAGAGVLVT